jgi:hypothetical protein
MPDPIELMLMADRSPEMQKALAQGLRRKSEIGALAQLTGDEVLQPFGVALSKSTQVSVQAEAMNLQRKAQRDLTQTYYDQLSDQFGKQHALAIRKQEEAEKHNAYLREVGSPAERRLAMTMQKNFDDKVRKYSETMTRMNIPELKGDMVRVSEILDQYREGGTKYGQGIEGVGGGGWKPNRIVGDEAVRLRQGIASVRNKLLKLRSGAAVTDPEMARFAEELLETLDGMSTDREILIAFPEIAAGVANIEAGIGAGYPPEVIATWTQRFHDVQGTDPRATGVGAGPPPPNPDEGVVVADWGTAEAN